MNRDEVDRNDDAMLDTRELFKRMLLDVYDYTRCCHWQLEPLGDCDDTDVAYYRSYIKEVLGPIICRMDSEQEDWQNDLNSQKIRFCVNRDSY